MDKKDRIMLNLKILALCLLLCAGILLLWLLYPEKASSGHYLDSAHGNYTPSPGYGVFRTSLSIPPNDYGRGNCTHCHEQHASIGGTEPAPSGGNPSKYELFKALFTSQAAGFCYGCHDDPGSSTQFQISMPFQYNYSRISGGDTNTCPNDIKEAFQFVNNTTGASPVKLWFKCRFISLFG